MNIDKDELRQFILDQCYTHDVMDDKGNRIEHTEGHSKKCAEYRLIHGRALCLSEMELSA